MCVDGNCDCPSGFSGELCEIDDACVNIECDYGGECVIGECYCNKLSHEYLKSEWLVGQSTVFYFDGQGKFTLGIFTVDYVISNQNIIFSSMHGTWTVSQDEFTCEKFNFVDGAGQPFTAIRS